MLLADLAYNVPANIIVDSARRALTGYDVFTSMVKSWVFGSVVAMVSDDDDGDDLPNKPPALSIRVHQYGQVLGLWQRSGHGE